MPVKNGIDFDKARRWVRDGRTRLIEGAATYCAIQAHKYAPVDTSFLRNSIQVVHANTGDMSVVYVGAYYGVFVELGHTTPSGTFVPPNPFLRLALQDTAAAWPGIAQKAFAHAEAARTSRTNGAGHLGAEFTA